MDANTFRAIISERLFDALFESNYEIWVESLPEKVSQPYRTKREKVAHYFVKKYGWSLEYCRALTFRDIETLLVGEVDFQKIPASLQRVADEAFDAIEFFSVIPKHKKKFLADHLQTMEIGKKKRNN